MAGPIKQEIDIKTNITGLESARKAKQELKDIKNVAQDLAEQGKLGGDVDQISGAQKQINMVRQMHQIVSSMTREANKGAVIGSNQYVKNLQTAVKEHKKISDLYGSIADDASDIKDNMAGATGGGGAGGAGGGGAGGGGRGGMGALGAIGMARNVAGGITQETILPGVAGGATQIGQYMAGKGGALGTAGKVLAGTAIGAGILGGFMDLVSGRQERRAELGLGIERRMGKVFTPEDLGTIRQFKVGGLLQDQSDLFRSIDAYMKTTGAEKAGFATLAGMTSLQMRNVSPETAGRIAGFAQRAGGALDTRTMERLAIAGGYGRRMDTFSDAIADLTGEMQNMGEMMDPKKTAQVLSDLGTKGLSLRDQAGITAMGSMNRAIIGAQGLQTPAQALMFRALSAGGKKSYSQIMDRMAQGVAGEGNLESILGYMNSLGLDEEGKINILREQFGLSRAQAKALISGKGKPVKETIDAITARSESVFGESIRSKREMGTGRGVADVLKGKGKDVMDWLINRTTAKGREKYVGEETQAGGTFVETEEQRKMRETQEALEKARKVNPAEAEKWSKSEEGRKTIEALDNLNVENNIYINGTVNSVSVSTKKGKKKAKGVQ